MFKKSVAKLVLAAAVAAVPAATVSAKETVLQAVSCFPQGSFFSKRFEAIVETVNETGKGVVQLNYIGGAPAIGSPFTLIQKMSQGVYDIGSCTGAYYQNVVPEADAWKMLERSPTEIRENGGWALMDEIHRAKNLVPLARIHYGTKFHLFLGEGHKIDKPDLTGLHLRVVPIYTNFFKSMGATTQNANISQIFSLMENGTVNGYGWPVIGHQPGWEKVTKYRVDPGFYDADINMLANARAWDGLSPEAQEVITKAFMAVEADAIAKDGEMAKGAGDKQIADGFELIEFTGDEGETWSNSARDAGWAGIVEVSPEHGPKLREFFATK